MFCFSFYLSVNFHFLVFVFYRLNVWVGVYLFRMFYFPWWHCNYLPLQNCRYALNCKCLLVFATNISLTRQVFPNKWHKISCTMCLCGFKYVYIACIWCTVPFHWTKIGIPDANVVSIASSSRGNAVYNQNSPRKHRHINRNTNNVK